MLVPFRAGFLSMVRSQRLTPVAIAVAAILVLGASVATASLLPSLPGLPALAQSSPEAEQGPSAEKVAKVVERLGAAGIKTTSEEFTTLAAKYGVGGAVRILAFADAAGKSTADITAMFDAGKGWGEIRRELGLSIGPGIGWIMGQGHGKPDKAAKTGSDEGDAGD